MKMAFERNLLGVEKDKCFVSPHDKLFITLVQTCEFKVAANASKIILCISPNTCLLVVFRGSLEFVDDLFSSSSLVFYLSVVIGKNWVPHFPVTDRDITMKIWELLGKPALPSTKSSSTCQPRLVSMESIGYTVYYTR